MESEVRLAVTRSVRQLALSRRGGFAWIVLAMLCGLSPRASGSYLIWNPDLGTAISASTFDASGGLVAETLNFTPQLSGSDSLTISSAGFVWLGAGGNTSQNTLVDNESDALHWFESGVARIAPVWYDLDPDLGGSVYFNQTSDGTTSDAIVTFVQVPSDSSTTDPATFQMQLLSNGVIIFSYMLFDQNSLGSDPGALIGLTTAGNFSPVAVDLTSVLAGQPVSTGSTSIYDYFQSANSFDLSGQSIVFKPQSAGGYQIAAAVAPEPATFVPTAAVLFLFAAILFRHKRITKY